MTIVGTVLVQYVSTVLSCIYQSVCILSSGLYDDYSTIQRVGLELSSRSRITRHHLTHPFNILIHPHTTPMAYTRLQRKRKTMKTNLKHHQLILQYCVVTKAWTDRKIQLLVSSIKSHLVNTKKPSSHMWGTCTHHSIYTIS